MLYYHQLIIHNLLNSHWKLFLCGMTSVMEWNSSNKCFWNFWIKSILNPTKQKMHIACILSMFECQVNTIFMVYTMSEWCFNEINIPWRDIVFNRSVYTVTLFYCNQLFLLRLLNLHRKSFLWGVTQLFGCESSAMCSSLIPWSQISPWLLAQLTLPNSEGLPLLILKINNMCCSNEI